MAGLSLYLRQWKTQQRLCVVTEKQSLTVAYQAIDFNFAGEPSARSFGETEHPSKGNWRSIFNPFRCNLQHDIVSEQNIKT